MAQGDFVSEDENSFFVEGLDGFQRIYKTPQTIQMLDNLKKTGAVSKQFTQPQAPQVELTPGLLPESLAPKAQPVSLQRPAQPVVDDAGFEPAIPAAQPAAMGGAGFVPVQMNVQTPGSSVTTERKQISPEARKAIDASFEAQAQAVKTQLALEQEAAKREAEYYGAMQGEYEASYIRQENSLKQKRDQYDAARGRFEESVKNFAEAKIKDPRAEESFAQKLGAAIAVGLGAYASAKTGGPNTALQILNASIERQIQLQKMDIEKKGAEVNLRRNDLALLKEELGDISQAEAAYRVGLLQKAEVQTKIAAAKSKNPIIQAKADQMNAAIASEKAKVLAELDTNIQRTIEQTGGASIAYGATPGLSASDLKKANKEVAEFDNAYNSVVTAFDKSAKLAQGLSGLRSAFPSRIGGTKGEKSAEESSLAAAVIGKVAGIRSDADYDRIIVPLLPSAGDRLETINAKRNALENFFKSYAPESWIKLKTGSKNPSRTFQPN